MCVRACRNYLSPQRYFFFWWRMLYIGIFALLVGGTILFCMIRELIYQNFTLQASTNMHNHMFKSIMRAPMWFFDVTPLGRVLNRFSQGMCAWACVLCVLACVCSVLGDWDTIIMLVNRYGCYWLPIPRCEYASSALWFSNYRNSCTY